jgi:hypothetical protein
VSFLKYEGWGVSGRTHEAVRSGRQSTPARGGRALRATKPPADQCFNCGTKRGLRTMVDKCVCRNPACIREIR